MEAMAPDDGQPAVALIDRLRADPAGFDLFQAISLIERAVPGAQSLGRGNGNGEAVRLRGLVSLAFQPRDIATVASSEAAAASGSAPHGRAFPERAYTLTTPVMTLAGAGGPLPLAYTEMLLERRAARDPAMADLLDIFNHRFLSFLYRGRLKHAPALGGQRPAQSTLAACLGALSNLGVQRTAADDGSAPWLRHAGLLGAAPRSMAALTAMLSDRLRLPVAGTQFVGGWLPVEAADAARLGGAGRAGSALGAAAVLGRRTWDQAAGYRLDVTLPARAMASRMAALLPGGRDHALMARLVRAHASQPFDVEIAVHGGAHEPARLGHGARLGWTARLAGAPSVAGLSSRPAGPARHSTPWQATPVPVRFALRPPADTFQAGAAQPAASPQLS